MPGATILPKTLDSARKSSIDCARDCGRMAGNIPRDSNVLPGVLISGFMKRIGLADHVIVVLSDKYLRSPYCMTELYSILPAISGEKADFLRRIIPLVLDDARFGTWRDRVAYAEHWEKEFKAMECSATSRNFPRNSPRIEMRLFCDHSPAILL
jgi:hypothetical protein